jgi:hypothetical protein
MWTLWAFGIKGYLRESDFCNLTNASLWL